VEWSEELYRMLGLAPGSAPPDYTEHAALFTPGSWEQLSTALARTRDAGTPYELELEMSAANGRGGGWMLARGEAMRDASGAVVALRGVALDITERKRAEISALNLSRLYAALSECSAAVAQCKTQESLFKRVCEVVVEPGGHDHGLDRPD
jgi:hypothetical protein